MQAVRHLITAALRLGTPRQGWDTRRVLGGAVCGSCAVGLRLGRGLSVLMGAPTVERGCARRVEASAEPVRRPVWVDDFCWVDVAMLPLLVVAVLPLAAWIVLRSTAVRMIGSGEQVPDG